MFVKLANLFLIPGIKAHCLSIASITFFSCFPNLLPWTSQSLKQQQKQNKYTLELKVYTHKKEQHGPPPPEQRGEHMRTGS